MKLDNVGQRITKVTGKANMFMNGAQLVKGYIDDDYQFGYNSIKAAASVAGGWAGARLGAMAGINVGAEVGMWLGVGIVPATIIGGVAGGIIGSLGGSTLGEWTIDNFYLK